MALSFRNNIYTIYYLSPNGIPGFLMMPAVFINSSSSKFDAELGRFDGLLFRRGFFGCAARS